MKLILLLILTFASMKSWGYANFIGHGYTSCMNCHFNPFGGGQLNDYGRVVSATAISSRALYPKTWDEEKIAYTSGFLFRKPKQDWIRTQVNYRGFKLMRNPGSPAEDKMWITMQSDFRATLKFGENDKFIFSGDYGRIPYPQQQPVPGMDEDDRFRSRSHFIGYRPSAKVGIYAGLMDKVYGLRVLEHTAFSRINPQVTQNDQTHGVAVHLLDGEWEGGAHAFGGNLEQDAEYRMKGASGMVEKTVLGLHRVGASALTSKNDSLKLTSYAVHGRFNVKEGSAILSEIGQTQRQNEDGVGDRTARYGLLQTYVRPWRGFYIFANIEHQKNDISLDDSIMRWGPGLQYFPIQRIELRADAYNTRTYSHKNARRDSWLLLFQTHIWL